MKYLFFLVFLVTITSCNKRIDDLRPLNQIDVEGQLASLAGIVETTVGTYTLLKSSGFNSFLTPVINIGEGRGNNVTLQQFGLINKESDAYFFRNSNGPLLGFSSDFYRGAFQIIVSINTTLEGIDRFMKNDAASLKEEDKNILAYTRGENIFLRAFTYFNLIRIYGKPYYQNAATSSGIPVKLTSDTKEQPKPSTVKEVYDFIIDELKTSANLMNVPVSKKSRYACREAAWALLSRVYLYMGGSNAEPNQAYNKLAVSYADSVIDQSGAKYNLLQGQAYEQMFGDDESGGLGRAMMYGNKEIIWAMDNSQGGSEIGKQFHYDDTYVVGATFLPSKDFKELLKPDDIRAKFFKENIYTKFEETTKYLCMNQAWFTYAPFIFIRLGEIYLNRAEAYAKIGNMVKARENLKMIHTRAGLSGEDIDSLPNATVLMAILKERRLELAFEGHSGYDNFRNGLPLIRSAADNNGTELILQPTDARVVFSIPTL